MVLKRLFCGMMLSVCTLLMLALPAAAAGKQSVRVTHYGIYSEVLEDYIRFNVYIPNGLDERIIGGYPVLYLLHGQGMGNEIWDELDMKEKLSKVLSSGEFPPFYVVAPQEDNNLISLWDSKFGSALLETVIPFMDAHYNTCARRECRAIGGISRGALWAEKLAFENPEVFSSAGLHSLPGSPFGEQELYVYISRQSEAEALRIRIDIGSNDDYRHFAQEAAEQLNFIGYPYEYEIRRGAHNADYWGSQLEEYLRWYSTGWENTLTAF